MKKIMILMVAMGLAACEQKAEQPKAEQMQTNQTQVVEKAQAPEQQAEVSTKPMASSYNAAEQKATQTVAEVKASQPAPTMVKEPAQEVATSEPIKAVVKKKVEAKPVVAPKPAAVTPQVKTAKPTPAQPVAAAKEEVVATAKPASKVVAPLVQGKQPIKAKPNPAPSQTMQIKSAQTSFRGLTKKCKSCHKTDKNGVGPSFKNIQAAYGDAATLAKSWASGFAAADRPIAGNPCNPNYKKYTKKAKTMTGQYKKLIKKAVEKGKFTYQELADEVFSK
jgi:cytochrome c551/c552